MWPLLYARYIYNVIALFFESVRSSEPNISFKVRGKTSQEAFKYFITASMDGMVKKSGNLATASSLYNQRIV